MDPTIAVRTMRALDATTDECIHAARALLGWFVGGGFTPEREDRAELFAEAGRIADFSGPNATADEHLEASYEDRYGLEIDEDQ